MINVLQEDHGAKNRTGFAMERCIGVIGEEELPPRSFPQTKYAMGIDRRKELDAVSQPLSNETW
jgi:hypothetical protein